MTLNEEKKVICPQMLLAGLLAIFMYIFFIQIKCTFHCGGNLFTPQEMRRKNETDTAQFKKDKYIRTKKDQEDQYTHLKKELHR